MKVLSLFDGISCGMVALERAGIPVERYVAYEIEPNAIKISKKNYPQRKEDEGNESISSV
jgi:DNA (cytosine-5)-methyltransferase 3A